MIISYNGLDGSGKTTQLKNIFQKYFLKAKMVDSFDFPDYIVSMDNQQFHEWWFNKSSVEEFCDIMYKGIKKRELEYNRQVCLIDKGLSTFDARIWATLRLKGLNSIDATNKIKEYKRKYNIIDKEEIKILLINDNANNAKVISKEYDNDQIELYKKYRRYQSEFLDELYKNGYYTFVYKINESIDSLTQKIHEDIINFKGFKKRKLDKIDIKDLLIPTFEKKIISEIVDFTKNTLTNNLLGVLVHGSISRSEYIPTWSDIDILIFVKFYDSNNLGFIDEFIHKYKIKIGITTFSEYELFNGLIDAKSTYSIYSYNAKKINSLIYSNNLKLPSLSINDLIEKNRQVIPESIHKLKRILYGEITSKNFKEAFKLLTLIMKVELINNHYIFSNSYYQTFYNFSYVYNLDIINVDDFIKRNDTILLKKFGIIVINLISNGGVKNE